MYVKAYVRKLIIPNRFFTILLSFFAKKTFLLFFCTKPLCMSQKSCNFAMLLYAPLRNVTYVRVKKYTLYKANIENIKIQKDTCYLF